MKNKLKKRLNKYFGAGFWKKLSREDRKQYMELGAHKIWRLHREDKLPNYMQ